VPREIPPVAQLRPVCQPAGLRGAGEHWAGRLYMRRVSIHATRVLLRAGAAPNPLTLAMMASGVLAGAALAWPGLSGAVLAAVLVQVYLLLDCSDGEVARWLRRTSIQGVYLDRVGHYFSEAALLVGLGWRAAGDTATGYAFAGALAALGAVLIKAETDLVDVARARAGMPAAVESSAGQMRSGLLALGRRVVGATKFHRLVQAVELSILAVVAAVVDLLVGDTLGTRVLLVICFVAAVLQTVLHLVSILASRRLA
jgi:phosphatidylglycerophosphate synthase